MGSLEPCFVRGEPRKDCAETREEEGKVFTKPPRFAQLEEIGRNHGAGLGGRLSAVSQHKHCIRAQGISCDPSSNLTCTQTPEEFQGLRMGEVGDVQGGGSACLVQDVNQTHAGHHAHRSQVPSLHG